VIGVARRRWALILLLGALLGAAFVWGAGSYLARPVNSPVAPPPAPAVPVRLMTRDGVPIAGSYWPGSRPDGPAVLLMHGINNTRRLFDAKALWLNGLGYAVLAIDLRGHGESGAVERTFGWRESEDAGAALRWLRAGHPGRRVGVIGVSLGGAAALLEREGPLPVQAMVLHAVYPDIRTAIANRIARFAPRPLARLAEPLLSDQSYLRYGVAPERIAPIEGLRRYRGPVLIIGGRCATFPSFSTPSSTRARANGKLKLIGDYLKRTPDPDRGYGLAALTGDARHSGGEARRDPGDRRGAGRPGLLHEPRLCRRHGRDGVAALAQARGEPPEVDDGRSASARWSSGWAGSARDGGAAGAGADARPSRRAAASRCSSSRPGSSASGSVARLAKTALAQAFGLEVEAVEEVWHGSARLTALFDWAEGRGAQPTGARRAGVPPVHARPPARGARVSLDDYAAEWKWDGIRVQLVRAGGETRLYSRTGDDISGSFPEVAEAFRTPACSTASCWCAASAGLADAHGGAAASFNALQQRLGRKLVSAKMLGDYPAFVRLYDILFDGEEDLRELAWTERRKRLEPSRRARPGAVRRLAADRGARASTSWRRSAPAPATPRSRA
jgi:pimeloyl-ACP methyl ester carboxylesterase